MRNIEFVRMVHEGDASVLEMPMAKTLGIHDAESLSQIFGSEAEICSITLRPATKRLEQEIDRATYVLDQVLGARKDETLLPQKRAGILIESWSGFSKPVSEDAYLDLPASVATYIDNLLLAHLYPSAYANPSFFQTWRKSQQSSA